MRTTLKTIFHLFIFALLTIVTQIGGLVYVISLFVSKKWQQKVKLQTLILFVGFYLIATFLIVPLVAPIFGREPVSDQEGIRPTTYMTVLLNRNYVKPELNNLLTQANQSLKETGIKIHYLDANFPFIDKFPLLPHLSHNDGKKIDISLIYETENGEITAKQKAISGYGIFEDPLPNEYNQIEQCLNNSYFQYDFSKYITFGELNKDLHFSEKGTKTLINSLLKNNNLGTIFIEPHLKQRMNLTDYRVIYHGCWAVRHDDHIHIQLK